MSEDIEDKAEDGTVAKILDKYNLKEQWATFVREFIALNNGTQAAIAAGYSEKTAHVQASRLLSNDKVQIVISKIRTAKALALEFGKDDVIGVHIEIIRDPTSSKTERQKSADALQRIYGMNDDKLKLAGDLRMTHDQMIEELEKEDVE